MMLAYYWRTDNYILKSLKVLSTNSRKQIDFFFFVAVGLKHEMYYESEVADGVGVVY